MLNIRVEMVWSPHGGEKLVQTSEAQKEDRINVRGEKGAEGDQEKGSMHTAISKR